jgi:hypothetical protein
MKKFDFTTLEGVTVSISVNPAGFVRVEAAGKSRSMALLRFARALHANPNAVSAEPLEGAVKLRLGDGSVWMVFADTQHIAEVPATADASTEPVVAGEPIAVSQPQRSPDGNSDGNSNETPQKSAKIGRRKMAFFQALSSVLAARGLPEDEIQDIIANLSALNKRRADGREHIDTSTPEGKLLAAARRLFFHLKRHVTRWESRGGNLNILFDGTRLTIQFPDGEITYPPQ